MAIISAINEAKSEIVSPFHKRLVVYIIITIMSSFVLCDGFYNETLVQLHWITQPLDHFVFRDAAPTYNQRVYVDYSYRPIGWEIQEGMPILVYIGGETSIEAYVSAGCGIVALAASKLKALVVFIEHRFYGESVPSGSIYEAMDDPEVRGTLASHQALADIANVILTIKSNLSLHRSPVVVFGGSYPGMLAAWFRLKYPHIAVGALASSAPLLNSEDLPVQDQYCSIVSRDFRDENKKCYDYISRSWSIIDDIASKEGGMETLSKSFSTCSPIFSADQLKGYLVRAYNYLAQYNGRYGQIQGLCKDITLVSEENILKGIGDALLKLTQEGTNSCTNIGMLASVPFQILDSNSTLAWNWQACIELVPHRGCSNLTMFEEKPFDLSAFMDTCYQAYGVYPYPKWISTYYGGQDIKSTLKTFGSNIIFSNGLMDPLSGASILEDVSKTIIAITTKKGSHCLDLNPAQDDDPGWLKNQRKRELEVISHWIKASLGIRTPIGRIWYLFIFVCHLLV